MPTYDLGTATVSTRAALLLRASYERENLPPGETTTAAQVLAWIHEDTRNMLAQRVRAEKQLQRVVADQTEDDELDGEVTVE